MIVLLDAGPLGIVTNPAGSAEARAGSQWLETLLLQGGDVRIPEIADYEVRRELLRAKKTKGLARLDALKQTLGYLAITTEVMLLAAELWAQARQVGQPTADDKALDGDMILSAQALVAAKTGERVVIATLNIGHLSLFANAALWKNISLP